MSTRNTYEQQSKNQKGAPSQALDSQKENLKNTNFKFIQILKVSQKNLQLTSNLVEIDSRIVE